MVAGSTYHGLHQFLRLLWRETVIWLICRKWKTSDFVNSQLQSSPPLAGSAVSLMPLPDDCVLWNKHGQYIFVHPASIGDSIRKWGCQMTGRLREYQPGILSVHSGVYWSFWVYWFASGLYLFVAPGHPISLLPNVLLLERLPLESLVSQKEYSWIFSDVLASLFRRIFSAWTKRPVLVLTIWRLVQSWHKTNSLIRLCESRDRVSQ